MLNAAEKHRHLYDTIVVPSQLENATHLEALAAPLTNTSSLSLPALGTGASPQAVLDLPARPLAVVASATGHAYFETQVRGLLIHYVALLLPRPVSLLYRICLSRHPPLVLALLTSTHVDCIIHLPSHLK